MAELPQRASRLGGSYQPLYAVPEEEVVESEIDNQQNPVDTEEDSVIMRAGNWRLWTSANTTQKVKKL